MGEEKTMDFIVAHIWSIQGWIHSKRRNRLGQDLVERLVSTHTNLQLEHHLELYEDGMIPWDIEMTVEESLSDDEDGVPHGVSDSESVFILSSTLFLYLIFNFLCILDLQNEYRQIVHVLH